MWLKLKIAIIGATMKFEIIIQLNQAERIVKKKRYSRDAILLLDPQERSRFTSITKRLFL